MLLPSSPTPLGSSFRSEMAVPRAAEPVSFAMGPYLGSEPSGTVQDLLSTLRVTQEELQTERRHRTRLETDVQQANAQVAQLSARVEALAEQAAAGSSAAREAARVAEAADRRATLAAQEASMRWEKSQMGLQAAVAEVVARQ